MEWLDETLIEVRGEQIFQRLTLRPHTRLAFMCGWLILCGVLVATAIVYGDQWRTLARANQFFELVQFPPRGTILDRTGLVLAANTPSLDILVNFSAFKTAEREAIKFFLAERPVDFTVLYERYLYVTGLTDADLIAFRRLITSPDQIRVVPSYRRTYPLGAATGNVIGYVGFPRQAEITKDKVRAEEYVGRAGLESSYQAYLRGVPGITQLEKNVGGIIRRSVEQSKLQPGATLRTTLDGRFQKTVSNLAEAYFRNRGFHKGVIIALDPRSGEILALFSYPNFDGNSFLISRTEVERILTNPFNPLFNRAVSGLYAPGSTIKPIVAAAALEEKLIKPNKKIYSNGVTKIPNPYLPGQYSVFKDWKAHGWTDLEKALAESVNSYFYMLGGGLGNQQGLGVTKLKRYYQYFGLGQPTGIDLFGEEAGFIPDPQTKRRTLNPIWRLGDTYNLSIGQGDLLVTPIQIALFTTAMATNKLPQPYLVQSIIGADGKVLLRHEPKIIRDNLMKPETLKVIQSGLRQTVTVGTAKILQGAPVAVAGKSGTPEIFGKRKLNAIFTGYAPADKPEIVLTVLVEEVPLGSVATLPLYKDLMTSYFAQRYPSRYGYLASTPLNQAATSATSTNTNE